VCTTDNPAVVLPAATAADAAVDLGVSVTINNFYLVDKRRLHDRVSAFLLDDLRSCVAERREMRGVLPAPGVGVFPGVEGF
jgi:hypothetical protein